jgi:hypothetical protein
MPTQDTGPASQPAGTITRRQLVTLGATGVAGAVLGSAAKAPAAGAARPRLGGIHISVVTNQVQPPPPTDGFIHTFDVTLWGPDDALTGMGCGWTEGTATQNAVGTGLVGCVFGGHAKVEGDVVKATAVMLYSGMPDEKLGIPFKFEANLATGFCRFTDMNMGMGSEIIVEGVGSVVRI